MSDLYTRFMEKAAPILRENWQLSLIGCGALFLLGAIFNWKWMWNPEGHRPLGFNVWVYRNFGEKGARINSGVSGAIIIISAIAMWVFT